ncbi:unnamed protein product [Spirodela intermedia]|uniref:non-specific serine/threonine protein kinase n=1 Tax=Spirodela intermedia TaxID=51605 RepID=A0A7I8L528_SPIIN|nr:unnamed protein product [Spirodela intermedia]
MNFPPFNPWKGCLLTPWPFFFLFFFFCVFSSFATRVVQAQTQKGFISVDCGFAGGSEYRDDETGVTYIGDSQFIDTGENHIIPVNSSSRPYRTLRSFPNGTRNCFTLSPVKSGDKYLIRAGFLYGNYDGRGFPPIFDLHIGVNFWTNVKMESDSPGASEIITVAPADLIRVCLVNTGKGTPFISTLELRPLLDFMYPLANASQSLANHLRWNYGMANKLRYPDDPYDRVWDGVAENFFTLNTSIEVVATEGDAFQVPSPVLRSAISESRTNFHLDSWQDIGTLGDKIYIVMHFAELQKLNPANESRRLNIYVVDGTVLLFTDYRPPYLRVDHKEIVDTRRSASGLYNISIYATSSSTLSYIINALESFVVRQMNESQTDVRDVSAIDDIRRVLRLVRNWEADPCSPREYIWEGVNCTYYEDSRSMRITSLNLSSSGLDGQIPTSIGNLTALTTLDLSNNNLTGPVPDILGELLSLRFINLSGNEAIGVIPQNLCEKVSKGTLSLSMSGKLKQCKNSDTNNKKVVIPVTITTSIVVTILLVVSFWIIRRKRKSHSSRGVLNKKNYTRSAETDDNGRRREIVQYTYAEIRQITKNFQHQIGKGGFGIVYLGHLRDGTMVAVKVLSSSSSQGSKEFEAEVLLLARVHHKNLVCLLGYCDDAQHLSLVYEYMDNRTLRDHLSGEIHNASLLNWSQRVNIALQAAQGLDYLHNGCRPPIIHRDIKSSNILLNCGLVAKIADFGLSRAFNNDSATHITTGLVGTPGYLDPRYYQDYRLNEKSDVYSFGIVLLEIITGQPPYQKSIEKTHIVKWVHSKVDRGDIMSIIDPRLQGDFNINMTWKIVEIAMSCTSTTLEERITMSNVVTQLKECVEVNESHNVLGGVNSSMQSMNDTLYSISSTPLALLAR